MAAKSPADTRESLQRRSPNVMLVLCQHESRIMRQDFCCKRIRRMCTQTQTHTQLKHRMAHTRCTQRAEEFFAPEIFFASSSSRSSCVCESTKTHRQMSDSPAFRTHHPIPEAESAKHNTRPDAVTETTTTGVPSHGSGEKDWVLGVH